MDLKYVARQLLRRPGHTLAVIACLVIGLVTSVGTFSVITSLFYGDMPGIAGRRSLARVFLRYGSHTGSESGDDDRRIVTAPLSFNDFAIVRELLADSALDAIGPDSMPCCPTSSRSVGTRIGVRLAIGAPPSRIVTLVIRQALKLVLAGMALGLALAVPMAFAMRATFVAKVTASDPMVVLPTLSMLLGVGILAAAVPALRASRIDPIATLRQE